MKTAEELVEEIRADGDIDFTSHTQVDYLTKFIRGIQADAFDHAAEIVIYSHQSVEAEEAIKSLAKALRV